VVTFENLTVVSVFGASGAEPGDPEYAAGRVVGKQLAETGFAVATGGYGGVMEAACRGASDAGGVTIGVTAPTVFPGRSGANPWVQHEIPADDLIERIAIMMKMSAAFIAMPGSIGTLAELIVAWNLAFVAPLAGRQFGPVVAVGETWKAVVPALATQLDTKGELVTVVEDAGAAVAAIVARLGAG
jgi:uncharacterized protein (TIGR00730 family)